MKQTMQNEKNMVSEYITYLFMHFNVQPIGHLIVLQEKRNALSTQVIAL